MISICNFLMNPRSAQELRAVPKQFFWVKKKSLSGKCLPYMIDFF